MKCKYLMAIMLPFTLAACAQTPSKQDSAKVENTPAPTSTLSAYHWQLADARNPKNQRIDALLVRADKPVQLDFSAGRLVVSNACNNLSGGYVLKGSELTISRMAATMKLCADEKINRLDKEVADRLTGIAPFSLKTEGDVPRLTLNVHNGDVLIFNGVPTAATRYGNNGETIFMEVAASTKPCHHPLMANMQCLQVRPVHFDKQGLKTGTPGAWENFYQNIKGYTHEDGIRNVLRIKRYTVANPPADASKFAYELDMVVESEIVRK